ncbi:TPA: peptide chain release factor N(5)-glutamine methyltransferase [Candidatus Avigastranaerophilus faecigallinarum]|nr:peptide chain release factor N(5)-glutamine methyltransferase [Candidatus Avigastranaerophilus faecigallinarum]
MYRKVFINTYLKNGFSFDEAKSEVDFALETLFNFTYKDFMLGKSLESWQIAKLEKVLDERTKTHRPIQQIIGQAYFYGRRFFVDEYTLIPRPETELLVDKVLEISKKISNPKILDIGTGSGCIPLTLILENNNVSVDAVDVSSETLETAKKNALFHNVLNNIHFFKSDLFSNVNDKYDIIVSNPPYIPLKEKENLQVEVKNYDPGLALFTKDDLGIEFYDKIVTKANDYLLPNGFLAFELGINQSDLVSDLLQKHNFSSIQIFKDYNSIDRVIICQK